MVRNDYLNPKCPRCSYGLAGLFSGKNKTSCPECNLSVTDVQSQVHVSRWLVFVGGLVGLWVIPAINLWVCWVLYEASIMGQVERGFTFLIVYSALYLLTSGFIGAKFMKKYRSHLLGSQRLPSGWMISGSFYFVWLLSVFMLVLSMGVWGLFMPSRVF